MTAGGKRVNSGRKPVGDKKKAVTIYTPKSRVDTLGIDTVKEVATNAIEKEFKKQSKNK